MDTLGQLLAVQVTPAAAQKRTQVAALTAEVQAVTGGAVAVALVDQGYTGADAATQAQAHGVRP